MLIHNSNLRADHERLQIAVRNLIGLWRESLSLSDDDPARHELISLMRAAYDDLCSTVQDPPAWEEVLEQLRDEVWLVEVWMVNSLPLGRDPIGTPFRLKNNILVGGQHAWPRSHHRGIGGHIHHSPGEERDKCRHHGAASSMVRLQE